MSRAVSPDRVPIAGDAFWSRAEVLTQASQCAGQVDIWEALEDARCTCPPSGFLCDECAP